MKGSITVCGKEYSLDHLYNLVRKAYYKYDYGMIFSYLCDIMLAHSNSEFSLKYAILESVGKWKQDNPEMDSLDSTYKNSDKKIFEPVQEVPTECGKSLGVSSRMLDLIYVHRVPMTRISQHIKCGYWKLRQWVSDAKKAIKNGTSMPKPIKLTTKQYLELIDTVVYSDERVLVLSRMRKRMHRYKDSYYSNKNSLAHYRRYADYQKRYREKVRKDPVLHAKYKAAYKKNNRKHKYPPSY